MRTGRPRTLLGVAAVILLVWLPAPASLAQDPAASPAGEGQILDPGLVVDPDPQPGAGADEPDEPPATTDTTATETETDVTDPPPADLREGETGDGIRTDSGWGSAAGQTLRAKQAEAEDDCAAAHPPVSRMLGVGGTVLRDRGTPWAWLVIAVVLAAAAVAVGARMMRRRRGRETGTTPRRTALEVTAALVAITVGLVGLAVQLIPGVGVSPEPTLDARLAVREVHARVTREEYARRTQVAEELGRLDRREVGNVVWLEIELRGYEDRQPLLQYGLYEPKLGGALLPGTARTVGLGVGEADVQTSFVPVWIGYPKSRPFEAQFRLLEAQNVREMATTGPLPGSEFRYACT